MQIRCNSRTVVAFDLDDTLYKEIDFVRSGYRAVSKLFVASRATAVDRRLNELFQAGRRDPFGSVADEFEAGIPVAAMLDTYRSHSPIISMEPGAVELLGAIRGFGARVAVVTDGRSGTQRRKLQALGLVHLVDAVVISAEVGSEKPAERNFRLVESAFPDSDSFHFVGDNPTKDFVTPKRLGWATVQVRDDGRNMHKQHTVSEARYQAATEVGSLGEIHITQAGS